MTLHAHLKGGDGFRFVRRRSRIAGIEAAALVSRGNGAEDHHVLAGLVVNRGAARPPVPVKRRLLCERLRAREHDVARQRVLGLLGPACAQRGVDGVRQLPLPLAEPGIGLGRGQLGFTVHKPGLGRPAQGFLKQLEERVPNVEAAVALAVQVVQARGVVEETLAVRHQSQLVRSTVAGADGAVGGEQAVGGHRHVARHVVGHLPGKAKRQRGVVPVGVLFGAAAGVAAHVGQRHAAEVVPHFQRGGFLLDLEGGVEVGGHRAQIGRVGRAGVDVGARRDEAGRYKHCIGQGVEHRGRVVGRIEAQLIGAAAQHRDGLAQALGFTRARAVFLVQTQHQVGFSPVANEQPCGAAQAVLVAPVNRIACGFIARETVALEHITGEALAQLLGDGDVDHAADAALVVVAQFERQVAGECASGALGDHRQGAAGGVAAEQRALRAAQHLDALEIIELVLRRESDRGPVHRQTHAVVTAQ